MAGSKLGNWAITSTLISSTHDRNQGSLRVGHLPSLVIGMLSWIPTVEMLTLCQSQALSSVFHPAVRTIDFTEVAENTHLN